MQPFLKDVATYIVNKKQFPLENYQLVVPNRRAGKFLLRNIQSHYKKPFWSPNIVTISEFTSEFCPFKIENAQVLLAELYLACLEIENENWESFDKFLKWGQLMLTDFNEIDSYLVNSKAFFKDLKNIKEIENWSLNNETLSKSQKELANFWIKLGQYYFGFHKNLLRKGLGYPGMASRFLAENIKDLIPQIQFEKILFIGFNALSTAEQTTIAYLVETNKAEIIWDIDVYYYQNKVNEAGLFFRRYKKLVKNNLYDLIGTTPKTIEIIGVPQNIGQADVGYSILSTLPEEAQNKTLVALADESLIVPFLNASPNLTRSLNASMGYNFRWNAMYDLVFRLTTLVKNALVTVKPAAVNFKCDDLTGLLDNAYFAEFIQNSIGFQSFNKLNDKLNTYPHSYVELIDAIEKDTLEFIRNLLDRIYSLVANRTSTTILLEELPLLITSLVNPNEKKLTGYEDVFHTQIIQTLHDLKTTFASYPFLNSIDTLIPYLAKALSNLSAPIVGDPEKGIQVMGMLEARALDFENIVMLSVNETIMPQAKNESSLIPHDLKRFYKLPTHIERDAIYANHFYRLIQRAKRLYFIYNTETDDFGSGEQSRFIAQLTHELPKINPNVTIKKKIYAPSFQISSATNLIVEKNSVIKEEIKKLLSKGVSPTMLSTYIRCPLDFYYQYILNLDEPEEENRLSPPVLGTCLHNSLEKSYAEYCNENITENLVDKIKSDTLKIYDSEVKKSIEKKFLQSGYNYMVFELGRIYLKKYFRFESDFLKQIHANGKNLTLLNVETQLNHQLSFQISETDVNVNILGTIDRMDRIDDVLRIVDYKTGGVSPHDLNFSSTDDLFKAENHLKSKALQVMIYAYLTAKTMHGNYKTLEPSLISMKNIREGYQTPKNFQNLNNYQEELEENMALVVKEMLNVNIGFTHNPDSKYCNFCA